MYSSITSTKTIGENVHHEEISLFRRLKKKRRSKALKYYMRERASKKLYSTKHGAFNRFSRKKII